MKRIIVIFFLVVLPITFFGRGNGSSGNRNKPSSGPLFKRYGIIDISAGWHALMLTEQGNVWSWGYGACGGNSGAHGHGTHNQKTPKLKYSGGDAVQVVAQAGGLIQNQNGTGQSPTSGFTSGSAYGKTNLSYILKSNGTTLLWGKNDYGVLGTNYTSANYSYSSSVRGRTTQGLSTSTHRVGPPKMFKIENHPDRWLYVSGFNPEAKGYTSYYGEYPAGNYYLGLGSSYTGGHVYKSNERNSSVTGVLRVSHTVHGGMFLKNDGKIYAWGYWNYSPTGYSGNSAASKITPTYVFAPGTNSIIASGLRSNFVVDNNGQLYTWGVNTDQNSSSQGIDYRGIMARSKTYHYQYTSISKSYFGNRSIVWMRISDNNGYFVTSNGSLYMTGGNKGGQIPTSKVSINSYTTTPKYIMGEVDIAGSLNGGLATYVVKNDGQIFVWGYNTTGGLGDNTDRKGSGNYFATLNSSNRVTTPKRIGGIGSGKFFDFVVGSNNDFNSIVNLCSDGYKIAVTINNLDRDKLFLNNSSYNYKLMLRWRKGTSGTIYSRQITGNSKITGSSSFTENVTVVNGEGTYTFWLEVTGDASGRTLFIADKTIKTFVVTTSATNVKCKGGNDGKIEVTIKNGSEGNGANYRYSIDNGAFITTSSKSYTFTGLSSKTYTIKIRDIKGCEVTKTQTVGEPSKDLAFSSNQSDITAVSCNGGDDGKIKITTIEGGNGTYKVSIDNGSNWSDVNNNFYLFSSLSAGDYTIKLKDIKNCQFEITDITVNEPDALDFSYLVTDVECNGENNGEIKVTISGGNDDYKIAIDTLTPVSVTDANNEYTFSNLLAKDHYTIKVTDGKDCEVSKDIIVVEPDTLMFSHVITDVSCKGDNNGKIEMTISGGNNNYKVSIDDGNTWFSVPANQYTYAFEDLLADNYSIKLIDDKMCVFTADDIIVDQPENLNFTANASDIIDVTCNGGNDGEITINISGGNTNYKTSMKISTDTLFPTEVAINEVKGSDSHTFTNIEANTYDIRVVDSKDCFVINDVVISEPDTLAFSIDPNDIVHVKCKGDSIGEIKITGISGGDGAHKVSINNNAFITVDANKDYYSFTGLTAKTHTIKLADSKGCEISKDVIVNEPNKALNFTLDSIDVKCKGGNDGKVIITNIEGGNGGYRISMDGGQFINIDANVNSYSFDSLTANNYYIKLIDSENCETIKNITINEPSKAISFTSETSNITDVKCKGGNDGEIKITDIEGGNGGYKISIDNNSWIDIDTTDYTFIDLYSGYYSIKLKDSKECIFTLDDIHVKEPSDSLSFISELTDISAVSCKGGNDGKIKITNINGGNGEYKASIDGGNTWNDINQNDDFYIFNGLYAGNYSIILKDIKNCEFEITNINVVEPADDLSFVSEATDITVVSCKGGNDGGIKITDIKGGNSGYEVSIDSNPWIVVNSNENFYLFEDLYAGNHSITLKDAKDCEITIDSIYIGEPTDSLTFTSDPTNITPVSCKDGNDGAIIITNIGGGNANYEVSIDDGTTWNVVDANKSDFTFADLYADSYSITIKDDKNCTFTIDDIIIEEPDLLDFNAKTSDIVASSCKGGSDGEITINITGGNNNYEVSIDNKVTWEAINELKGANTHTFTGLVADTFDITVTDAKSCLAINDIIVSEPDELTFDVIKTDITCYGADDGKLKITNVKGGNGNFKASIDGNLWFNISNDVRIFSNLNATNTYTVRVKDSKNCESTTNIDIIEPSIISFSLSKVDVNCKGEKDGVIEVFNIAGGTGIYKASIDNGVSWKNIVGDSISITQLSAKNYTVKIKDSNECTIQQDINIDEPNKKITSSINKTNISCYGAGDGSIDIFNISGGNGGFMISIDNKPFETVDVTNKHLYSNLLKGEYTINIKDSKGCVLSKNISIEEPDTIHTIITKINIGCKGSSNGKVSVEIFGGNGDYQISLDGSPFVNTQKDNKHTFENLHAKDDYLINIKDSKNCTYSTYVEMVEPDELQFSINTVDVDCFGGNNGQIEIINMKGGSGIYEVSKNDGAIWEKVNGNTHTFSNLIANTYSIRFRSENSHNCDKDTTIEILEPEFSVIKLKSGCLLDANDAIDEDLLSSVIWYDSPIRNKVVEFPLLAEEGSVTYYAMFNDDAKDNECTAVNLTIYNSIITRKSSKTLYVNNYDGLYIAYQWYMDGNILVGENRQIYASKKALNGTYHVELTMQDGTKIISCKKNFESQVEGTKMVLYPNPVKKGDLLYLELNRLNYDKQLDITIFDTAGRVILKMTKKNNVSFNTHILKKGVYLFHVKIEETGDVFTQVFAVK